MRNEGHKQTRVGGEMPGDKIYAQRRSKEKIGFRGERKREKENCEIKCVISSAVLISHREEPFVRREQNLPGKIL